MWLDSISPEQKAVYPFVRLSIGLPICQSVSWSDHLSVCLMVCPYAVSLLVRLSVCLLVCPSVYWSAHLLVCLMVCPFAVSLLVRLSVCLLVCPAVYWFIRLLLVCPFVRLFIGMSILVCPPLSISTILLTLDSR